MSASAELKPPRLVWIFLALLMLAAAGWKAFLLARDVVPFNADEAVVALMARHILQGERPVFFYGQAYMGSLDAYLVALGFWLWGEQVWVVRLAQAFLYLGVLGTTFWLGIEAFGSPRSGLLGVLLLAVPPVNVTLYTTASLGGYVEALLIGNLALVLALRLGRKPSLAGMGLWGGLAGLGLWADGLTLVYTLPALIYMAWQLKRESIQRVLTLSLALAAGGLIGALPWWLYAARFGFARLLAELFGSAVAVEQGSWLAKTGLHLVNWFLLGLPAALGLRPSWAVEWLGLPLIPLVLIAWGWVTWFWVKQAIQPGPSRPAFRLLGGVAGTLFAGFVFTSFGVDPSGRYFLPLAVPLALVAAECARSFDRLGKIVLGRWGQVAFLCLIVIFQVWGNLQVALRYPPGLTTQFDSQTIVEHRDLPQLIAFLKARGETRGYTNYWIAYPLAFRSGEDLIFIPRLPYHADLRYTARDDRYPPYADLVARSEKVAFITPRQSPLLNERLRAGFKQLGVKYQEQWIGDFHVYYALSVPVHPEELVLEGGVR